nr:hypothetical protein [Caballeronia sordidicola]
MKSALLTAIFIATAGTSTAAFAHVDVGIGFYAPAPQYVAPPPVVYGPPPVVYGAPPVIYGPQPGTVYGVPRYPDDGGDWREREWHRREWEERRWHDRDHRDGGRDERKWHGQDDHD